MMRPNIRHTRRIAAAVVAAAEVLAANQVHAETLYGAPRLRHSHNQQALDLRLEQQRHKTAHAPVTLESYLRLKERYRAERRKQRALQSRQSRDARIQGRTGGGSNDLLRQPSNRIRYQQQNTAQRLGFKLNRRP